jgi:hypothetical protein
VNFRKLKNLFISAICPVWIILISGLSFQSFRIDYCQGQVCHVGQGGGEMNKGFRRFITWLFGGDHETYMQAYLEPVDGKN